MKGTRKKKRWEKLVQTGRISLFRDSSNPNRFAVSWRKASGSYGRRRFNAESIEQAMEVGPIVAGLEQAKPDTNGITLLDGFQLALKEAKRGQSSRRDWFYQQTRFLSWLVGAYPTVSHWHQVTRRVIKDYLSSFDGRSPNHRRLMIQPIVQTAGFMEREFQMPNVTRKLGTGNANVRETPVVFIPDVVSLLDYLREEHPSLEVGAALQGLAALRITEALRLTWKRVDLERGCIEVSGDTKTSWSNRTIPIASRLLTALRRAWEERQSRDVIDLDAPVVVSPMGFSFLAGKDSYRNYTKALRAAMKAWNAEVEWRVKDLRNAVPTAMAMGGLSSDVSEQYMGHAPKGITARHYIPRLSSVTRGEEEAFAQAMHVFRTLVVDHVNRIVEGDGARILNFFEHGPDEPETEKA